MNTETFTKENDFIKSAFKFIGKVILDNPTICRIALCGGTTPKEIYTLLGESDFDFGKIEFYQVDERYVPRHHPDSNYHMIMETLAKPLHHFDTSIPIVESLKKYEREIADISFDLTILGIGTDGHIASLFPYSPALSENRLVAHTTTEIHPIKDRLTITLPKILESKNILVLLQGEDKKTVLTQLEHPTKVPDDFPALNLLKHTNLTLITDWPA